MSDYGDQYNYEEPEEVMEQENIETTLQFENFNAQELLRDKKYQQALNAFQEIYQKASDHNITSWKAKILNQLLQIHVQLGNLEQVKNTLHNIRQMNQVDKTNEQSVKGIIKTLGSVERKTYQSFWEDIFALIQSLDDPSSRLKCYFLMFEKQIKLKNMQTTKQLYNKINQIAKKINEFQPSIELQWLYFEILFLKLHQAPFKHILKTIYINLVNYENDTNTNETYLSKAKQQIAQGLYKEDNFVECANFLCGCFIQNSKYGTNNIKNKQLLKINTLLIFLCEDLQLLENNEFNPMLQQSTAIFKADADIQALYGLISAFKQQNIAHFEEVLKVVDLNLPAQSPYSNLINKVRSHLQKQKIFSICKCYKNVKFDYIQRRVNEPDQKKIQSILFSLITSGRINGVIHLDNKYLQILPQQNKYFTVQLQNLKDLTEKM